CTTPKDKVKVGYTPVHYLSDELKTQAAKVQTNMIMSQVSLVSQTLIFETAFDEFNETENALVETSGKERINIDYEKETMTIKGASADEDERVWSLKDTERITTFKTDLRFGPYHPLVIPVSSFGYYCVEMSHNMNFDET
ncbi:hypothetical protein WICPIJ_001607, partial [Wickerhamomyces pijperi]